MQTVNIESLLTLLTPVCSGLFCILLVSLRLPVWAKLKGTGMRGALLVYYAMVASNWAMLVLLTFFPREFVYVRIVMIYCGLLVPVMLYRVFFLLTRTDPRERFSAWNYVVPTAFVLVHLACSLYVPREVFARTSLYLAEYVPGYRLHYVIVELVTPLRTLISITYLVLCGVRYRRYRRYMADYSSELERSSLHWMKVFLILWLSCMAIPIPVMAFPIKVMILQLKLTLPAALLFLQHILLAVNVIRENYVTVKCNGDTAENGDSAKPQRKLHGPDFHDYLACCKPYLDPNITIVDMARGLGVNRTYLSAFINSQYGMNFSQFVNECRLRELDGIVANPLAAGKTNCDKITRAGFGSYQSYRRAIRLQERRKILPADE